MTFGHFDQTKINFSEQLHHFSGLPALALKKNYLFIFFVKYYLKKKTKKQNTHKQRKMDSNTKTYQNSTQKPNKEKKGCQAIQLEQIHYFN